MSFIFIPIIYYPAPPGFPTNRLHTADRLPYANRNIPDTDPGPLVAVQFLNPRRKLHKSLKLLFP